MPVNHGEFISMAMYYVHYQVVEDILDGFLKMVPNNNLCPKKGANPLKVAKSQKNTCQFVEGIIGI
jgi:hypothetical protein